MTKTTNKYDQENPLGGPAKVFEAMALAIRAGDKYEEVLNQFGFAEKNKQAEPELDFAELEQLARDVASLPDPPYHEREAGLALQLMKQQAQAALAKHGGTL